MSMHNLATILQLATVIAFIVSALADDLNTPLPTVLFPDDVWSYQSLVERSIGNNDSSSSTSITTTAMTTCVEHYDYYEPTESVKFKIEIKKSKSRP